MSDLPTVTPIVEFTVMLYERAKLMMDLKFPKAIWSVELSPSRSKAGEIVLRGKRRSGRLVVCRCQFRAVEAGAKAPPEVLGTVADHYIKQFEERLTANG